MTTRRWIALAIGVAIVLLILYGLLTYVLVMGGSQPDVIHP